ncbi:hypothetical protein D7V97_07465 [Corallococcus sp. CA053C]|uniref:hypothetical protein n=1 Tax=Corallococcus sp. CA053C TaxID=2316732 RepID=UPI000EA0BDBF|nr:hypothetical protein [Corallococcus sp. CA053C]RKH12797.1 hypothetical protein D7V97_07465 [Corallococcus sp. CA053C]
MAVKLVCFASYLTRSDEPWSNEDHNASKFIKAIKGNRQFKGFATVPVRRNRLRLEMTNRNQAYRWFGHMAGDYLNAKWLQHLEGPAYIVPLPSSEGVVGATINRFPALRMAEELQKVTAYHTTVLDILRWREPKPSASSAGGSRNANVLRENLVVTSKPPPGPCILVDDVCTSGGHLRAAVAALEASRRLTVIYAVCAGRTCQSRPENPWAIHVEELQEEPPDPFDVLF